MADEDDGAPEVEVQSGGKGKMPKPNYNSMFGLAPVERIETGVIPLDLVLGGGYTKGDVIQISSPSGIGKSTMILDVSKRLVFARGEKVCYCDVETGVKDSMLKNYGLLDIASADPKSQFLFLRPRTYTDFDRVMHDVIYNHDFQHMVVDSITSLTPQKATNREIEDVTIGEQARLNAALLMKWKAACREKGMTWWLINQARVKQVGIGPQVKFVVGSAGGKAQDHYPDIRLMMREGPKLTRIEKTAKGDQKVPYGNVAGIWAEKNRSDRPYIVVDCPVIFGKGVSNNMFIKDMLQNIDWITGGTGGHYKLELPGQEIIKIYGTENLEKTVKEHFALIKQTLKENGKLQLVYD